MTNTWKKLALPVGAVVIAGVALVSQLGSSFGAPSTAGVRAEGLSPATAADAKGTLALENWQETGLIGGNPGGTPKNPPTSPFNPPSPPSP